MSTCWAARWSQSHQCRSPICKSLCQSSDSVIPNIISLIRYSASMQAMIICCWSSSTDHQRSPMPRVKMPLLGVWWNHPYLPPIGGTIHTFCKYISLKLAFSLQRNIKLLNTTKKPKPHALLLVSILMEASAYLVFFFGVTLSVLLLKSKMFNHAFCAIFRKYFCPFKSSLSFFSWRILSYFWTSAWLQYSVHPDWSFFLFIYPPIDFACTSLSASLLALLRSPIRAIARPCPCDLHQAGTLCE